jgi:PSP1 C-terminal conserved region
MSSTAPPTLSNGQGPNKMPTAMENKNLGRQATPDSDAVVSSDEDHEPSAVMSMSMHSAKSMPTAHRPIRRPSWLSEVHSTQRKYSLGGISLASAGGSQPPTPSAENGSAGNYPHGPFNNTGTHGGSAATGLNTVSSTQSWDSLSNSSNLNSMTNSGRPGTGHSNSSSSFAWNSHLWHQPQQMQSSAHQKGLPAHGSRWSSSSVSIDPSHPSSASSTLPSQLQHFHLTSPTSSIHEDLRSPASTSIAPELHSSVGVPPSLPFEIPLEPNRKTIRSQSYSSGIKRSAVARRSSRPGIYNMDITHDDSNLYEVDEDESASPDVWGHSPLVTTATTVSNPATAEAGSQEDGISNVASFSPVQTSQSPSATHPHSSATFPSGSSSMATKHLPSGRSQRDASNDESETLDTYGEEMVAVGTQRAAEHAQSTLANAEQLAIQATLRAVGNVDQRKKGSRSQQHNEAFAFGGSGSPQMRRMNPSNFLPGLGPNIPQSFDGSVPRPSNMHAESPGPSNQPLQSRKSTFNFQQLNSQFRIMNSSCNEAAANSHVFPKQTKRLLIEPVNPLQYVIPSQTFLSSLPFQNLRSTNAQNCVVSKDVATRNSFERFAETCFNTRFAAQYFSNDIPRRDGGIPENTSPHFWRSLYLVSFKSSRSEIFMVPENSTLDPEVGDMVIVEGDRGQDMGIVKHSKLTWEQAKIQKAEYNRRHYKSLVMFSRMFPHVAAAANNDSEFSESTDAIAASNLASPRGRKEADATVPKLIKRIASEQEIKLLRDKEGNEAKAKRICQTKVNQHGIHMEILDAEFQLYVKSS